MRISLLILGFFLFCAPPKTAELHPGQVALIHGKALLLKEYKDYLYLIMAQSRLPDFLELLLLRKEAARLGVKLGENALKDLTKKTMNKLLKESFHNNPALMKAKFLARGFSMREMEEWTALDQEKQALQNRVVMATRKTTKEQVQRKFDELFGLNGEKVEIRHIQVSIGPLLDAALEKGKRIEEIDRGKLEEKTLARALDIKRKIDKGLPFEKAVLLWSDEPSVKAMRKRGDTTGVPGKVDGYNFQRFGGVFADAVRKLKPGEVSRPIPFRSNGNLVSYHLIRLDSRKITKLDQVREVVVHALMEEKPTFYEILKLKKRLLGDESIVTRAKSAFGLLSNFQKK